MAGLIAAAVVGVGIALVTGYALLSISQRSGRDQDDWTAESRGAHRW